MKQTCTRRIQFCSGHRVLGHESKCAHIHGHNYVAFITAESIRETPVENARNVPGGMMPHIEPTDEIGRVIDFSVLKDRIGGWIDEHWDHAMLWYMEDLTLFNLYRTSGPLHQMKNMALDRNPTAENMAQFLLDYSNSTLLHGLPIKVTEVVLWETENCYATATG